MIKVIKQAVLVTALASFSFSFPPLYAFDDSTAEKASDKKEELSCEEEVKKDNEASGAAMDEEAFAKAVKKCEKKRKKEENKAKCVPTGSRLSRC